MNSNIKSFGNLIWFLIVGLVTALAWFVLGIAWCVTIIGIPFGIQAFKFARLSLLPFSKVVVTDFDKHPILNILWNLFGGILMVLLFGVLGIVLCVTIIGIPFALQCFKLAKLAFAPFGAMVD